MNKVLVIGAGKMGSAIAKELADQSVSITLWNRSTPKLDALKAEIKSPTFSTSTNLIESISDADLIITLLTSGQSVEEVLLAPGVLKACKNSAIIVDMSTSGVHTATKLQKEISAAGLRFVDAPVSGSMATIASHQLLVMASGEEGAIQEITPTLMKFSKKVADLGPAGNGQVMKLAVNLIVHTLNAAIAESLAIATTAGVSIEKAYDILEESVVAAPFLKYKRPAFTTPGTPVAMRIDTVLKDMNLISGLAQELGVELTATPAVKKAYADAVAQGLSERDMASLLESFKR
jgi:3-hydroxyisobutyrate dehydrogenase-like beta-hydroxyacid dehydrogenase